MAKKMPNKQFCDITMLNFTQCSFYKLCDSTALFDKILKATIKISWGSGALDMFQNV